jgi:glutathione S-transferase
VPHILLIEAELGFELVLAEVDMAQDERFTAEFKALNQKKRVPVFKMGDEIITEVPAIVTVISHLAPERGFLGKTTMDTIRVYEWLNSLGGAVHGQAYGGLYRPERLVDDPELHAAVREKALKNLEQAFALIESKLRTAGTVYAVGSSFTAADAYLFVLYRWAGPFIPGLKDDFPLLSAWASKVVERKAILAAVHTGV